MFVLIDSDEVCRCDAPVSPAIKYSDSVKASVEHSLPMAETWNEVEAQKAIGSLLTHGRYDRPYSRTEASVGIVESATP